LEKNVNHSWKTKTPLPGSSDTSRSKNIKKTGTVSNVIAVGPAVTQRRLCGGERRAHAGAILHSDPLPESDLRKINLSGVESLDKKPYVTGNRRDSLHRVAGLRARHWKELILRNSLSEDCNREDASLKFAPDINSGREVEDVWQGACSERHTPKGEKKKTHKKKTKDQKKKNKKKKKHTGQNITKYIMHHNPKRLVKRKKKKKKLKKVACHGHTGKSGKTDTCRAGISAGKLLFWMDRTKGGAQKEKRSGTKKLCTRCPESTCDAGGDPGPEKEKPHKSERKPAKRQSTSEC